jgi:hypothetical protein
MRALEFGLVGLEILGITFPGVPRAYSQAYIAERRQMQDVQTLTGDHHHP